MSELRRDPFTGRWAVVAKGRGARPNEHATAAPSASSETGCPFCEGQEERTPAEVAAVRGPGSSKNGPGWSVRVIPNRFPTLEGADGETLPALPPGQLECRPGAGVHEVIIETPRHAPGMPQLEGAHLRSLFRIFRDRVRDLEARPGISSVVLFENWGPESGGTLWHPHAQAVASELVAPRVHEELLRFSGSTRGGCLLEAVTKADEASGARIIRTDEQFVALAPYGSEYPYEMRLVPRRHARSLSEATDAEVDALARLLPALLRAFGRVVPDASHNWVVHGVGPGVPGGDGFHWHVEVLPRLVRADGFELGSGLSVNPVPPEEAATQLAAGLDAASGAGGRKR